MPAHSLPVEHRIQEEDAGCLAACVQMALAHQEIFVSQQQLNRLFGLTPAGVPLSRLRRLEQYGIQAAIRRGNELYLQQVLDRNVPPIIFVRTDQLSYWKIDTRHAILIIGYGEDHLIANDPAFAHAPQIIPLGEVMLAWDEFDYVCALLSR